MKPTKVALLGVVFAIALAVLPAAAASGSPPTSTAATEAFGHLLRERYGDIRGFWTCPGVREVSGAKLDCLAEFRSGRRWHQTWAFAGLRNGRVVVSQVVDTAWVRHWSPYARHLITRSDTRQVPGLVSVNSPAYDWGFLLTDCGTVFGPGRTSHCDAYDGNGSGLSHFFAFTCAESGGLVTCTNALGDSVRYKPHPH